MTSNLFGYVTFQINVENYCLYAMVVQDRRGKGRPVALGFLATEKAENIKAFFNAFKRAHTQCNLATYFFVDKDYNEITQIQKAFPKATVLLCVWHVLAFVRKHMTRHFGAGRAPTSRHFYEAVYHSYSEADFENNWAKMMDHVPKSQRDYMVDNWYECRRRWSLA